MFEREPAPLLMLLLLTAASASDDRQVVNLLCISTTFIGFSTDPAYFNFSFSYINNNLSHLFPSFRLRCTTKLAVQETTGSAAKALIDGYLQPPNKALILGAAFSHQSQIVADIAQYYYLPQIGYASTSPALSDKTSYPYFIRMPITNSLFIQPTIELLKRFGWKKIGLIASDNEIVYPITLQLEAALVTNNISSYQKMIYSGDPTDSITNLLRSDYRIFVVVRNAPSEDYGKRFECVIKTLGAYGQKYFWIQIGLPFTNLPLKGSCPDSDRAVSLEGSIEFDSVVMDPAMMETEVGVAEKTLAEIYNAFTSEYPDMASIASPKTVGGFDLRFDSVMSAALAINQTLQAFNYTNDLQLDNSSFKAALFTNLIQLNFMGLSGQVMFDSHGDRSSVALFYQLRDLKRHLVGSYDPTTATANWTGDLWFADGTPPVDSPGVLVERLMLSWPSTVAIISVSSVGMSLSLLAVGVNFYFRELRLIKLSSPYVNNVIGLGCLLCYASCIVMSVNSYWTTRVSLCWLQAGLLAFGYSCAFGAMLAKTWRVHRIFTNVKLRRVAIKDSHLFAVILAVVAVDIVLFCIWAGVDPMQAQKTILPAVETLQGSLLRTTIDECVCTNFNMWIGIEVGVKGFLLLFGIFFAWETRTVQVEALNDSKKIGVCVYNTLVMGLIGVVLVFAMPSWGQELRLVLVSACIILCASTTLLLVFGSKIYMLMKHGPSRVDDIEMAMQASAGMSVIQGTAAGTSAS